MTGNVSTRNLTTLYGSTGTVTPVQSNVGNASIGSQNLTTLYRNSTAVIPQYPYGNANVESFLAVGSDPGGNTVGNITSSGQISATGNIITNGYFVGNFAGNITGNVTAPGANTDVLFNFQGNVGASNQFTFNIGSNTLTVANTVVSANVNTPTVYSAGMQTQGSDYVQMQYSNGVTLPVSPYDIGVGSWFYLDPGGGVFQSNTTGTLQTVVLGNDGTISATGNITAPYYFGNGSQLTGLPATYSNANVSNFLANGFGSNTITTTGNITAGYFLGNGSQLTGITAGTNYSNANVSAFLPVYGGTVLVDRVNFTNNSGIIEQGADRITITGNATNVNTGAYFNDTGEAVIFSNSYVAIVTNTTSNVNPTWTFDATGNLLAPGAISTTGNVSTGNIIVADDRVIYASHGYYGPPDATFAPVRVGLYGPNPDYAIGVESNYSWMQGQNGVKLYDASSVTLVANAAGITGANILTAGVVSASGNVTGNYILGNGSQLTGLPATYSNANVASFLANFGSNSISTSGNVTAGYFVGNGSLLSSITGANVSGTVANATYAVTAGSAGTANLAQYVTANAQANITSVGTLTGLNASGNISTSGNITGAYFLGNGSQLTGLPSTAPGGTNTQVQFNDGSAFAGNANLTFDKATGNFTAGNIVTVGSVINNKNAFAFSPANTLLSLNNARIIVGNAWDGNAAVQYDPINVTRGSRLAVMDKQAYDYTANSLQPGTRLLTSYFWLDLANTTVPAASSSRNSAGAFVTNVGNGISAQTGLGFYGVQSALVIGNASSSGFGNVGNIGNVTLNIGVGQGSFVNLYNGSAANTAIGSYSSLLIATAGGVMGNSIGYSYSRADVANNLSTWNIGYFHPDQTAIFGSSMSGNARLATNYYAFYNKDNYADVQLGSLRSFHYYTSNVLATGGSQAISKANGPYQTTTGNLTANLDVTSFTNFVTSNTVTAGTNTGTKLSSDVVTLLVPMGATPYSINMPTGNSAIRYVNGVSNVTGTANSLVQVQITGSNVAGTVQYLVNIDNSGGTPATYGNAQVASFLAAFGSNTISSTGNITTTANISAGYISGNGSLLTAITGANVTGTVANATYATTAGSATTAGTVTTNAQANITSVGTLTSLSATGNITGNYFIGNGSQLTGISTTYGNANVVTLLAAFGANTISTTGNITGGNLNAAGIVSAAGNITSSGALITTGGTGNISGVNYYIGNYFTGNGSLLTAITGANVSGTVANATYAVSAGSATTANTVTANAQANITSVGILTSLNASGNISTSGNITGAYFLGNGSQLTGIISSYGNANVVANLAALGSNPVSTTGNVTAGYFVGNGSLLTAITGANITGTVANATYATSAGSADTATTSGTVTSNAQANITSVGILTSLSASGNITGSYFLGNGSQLTGLPATYSNANVASFLAAFGSNSVSTTGNVTASYFVGNGSLLTSINASNVSGTVANATYATTAGSATTATTAGTVTTNAQPNITSVGTLTSLSVSGNTTSGNLLTSGLISATGGIAGLNFQETVYAFGNATGNITPNIALGSIQSMTLTGNITLNTVTSITNGQSATFIMTQDATGSRLLTSTWKFASNVRTLSTAANAVDLLSVFYAGNTYYATISRGYV